MNSLNKLIMVLVSVGVLITALTMPTKVLAEQAKTTETVELAPAQALAERLKDLKTYQAKFEQRVRNENGQQIDLTSGIFSIQRPNLFRWEVKQSFEQIIVADGSKIYTYDPELEQVTIQNQSKALSESPLLLMTSNAQELAEAFSIELLKLNENEEGNLFLLKPKGEGSVFESVHILFKDNKISELLMADTLGQQTSVEFSDIQSNIELDSQLFKFEIPDGIDVIDSSMVEIRND